jgi:hypothetical protein
MAGWWPGESIIHFNYLFLLFSVASLRPACGDSEKPSPVVVPVRSGAKLGSQKKVCGMMMGIPVVDSLKRPAEAFA